MYLTIITVNKNSGKNFERTERNIISIVDSYNEVEWLILDSDSTDISGDIIKKLKTNQFKKQIKVIIEKDKGIYYAMNKGIEICNSKFIIFINSGDTINKDILENFFLFKTKSNQTYVFGYIIKEEKSLLISLFKNLFKKFEGFFKFILPSSHNSIIYETKSIKKIKFNYKYRCGADFDQYYQLLNKKHNFIYKRNLKLTNLNQEGYISKNILISYKDYIDILQKNSYKFGYFYWMARLKLLRLKIKL